MGKRKKDKSSKKAENADEKLADVRLPESTVPVRVTETEVVAVYTQTHNADASVFELKLALAESCGVQDSAVAIAGVASLGDSLSTVLTNQGKAYLDVSIERGSVSGKYQAKVAEVDALRAAWRAQLAEQKARDEEQRLHWERVLQREKAEHKREKEANKKELEVFKENAENHRRQELIHVARTLLFELSNLVAYSLCQDICPAMKITDIQQKLTVPVDSAEEGKTVHVQWIDWVTHLAGYKEQQWTETQTASDPPSCSQRIRQLTDDARFSGKDLANMNSLRRERNLRVHTVDPRYSEFAAFLELMTIASSYSTSPYFKSAAKLLRLAQLLMPRAANLKDMFEWKRMDVPFN